MAGCDMDRGWNITIFLPNVDKFYSLLGLHVNEKKPESMSRINRPLPCNPGVPIRALDNPMAEAISLPDPGLVVTARAEPHA